jgi:ABC-2 type transport system permease protein
LGGEVAGGQVIVDMPAERSAELFRAAAVAGLNLRMLKPEEDTLETVFLRLTEQGHAPASKIAALSVFTLLATTLTTFVVVVCARPLAPLEGIEIEAWKTDFPSHLLEGYFNFTIAGLVWGLIGLTLAVLTRSSAMAIGIGIGFLLVVEGLITIVAPDTGPYLPGGTLSTLAAGGNDQLAWGAALGLVALYGVLAATVSLAVFRTRDIVS